MAKHYHRLHTTCQAQAQKDLRTIAFAHALSSSGITLVLKGIQSSNPFQVTTMFPKQQVLKVQRRVESTISI